ncbi:amidohydrolase family protein [Pseudonocardia sichuanensis]
MRHPSDVARAVTGLFLTDMSWTNFHGEDLEILARSGASVSYNAWVFSRNGIVMETFDKYLEAGVNVVMGTDSVTQSMLDSCRWTAILGKVMERRSDAATAGQVFDAATIAAARALGREDLGRVAPGCKADLLFWRTDSTFMTPMRDPIRNIVYYAEPEDLDKVMVDGRIVMENKQVPGLDHEAALAGVQAGAERVWEKWSEHDWAGRTMEQHVPLTYESF